MKKNFLYIFKSILLVFAVWMVYRYSYFAEYEYKELIFRKIRFVYYSFVALIAVFFILYTNRNNFSRLSGWIVFFAAFFYTAYWIPQGFDVTDEGFILSKSWFMLHGRWHENINLFFGSTLANSLWLNILKHPSLLWARLGYALSIASIALFSYKTLRLYFEASISSITTLIGVELLIAIRPQTIDYNVFPMVLISIASFLFLSGWIKQAKISFILSGLFFSVAFYSRFTYIIYLAFPLIFCILYTYYGQHFNTRKQKIKTILLHSYTGVFIGLAIGLLLLIASHSLRTYLTTIYVKIIAGFIQGGETISAAHNSNVLINKYLEQTWYVLLHGVAYSIFLGFIPVLLHFDKKKVIKTAFIFLFAWAIYYYMFSIQYSFWYYSVLGIYIAIFFLLFTFYSQLKKYLPVIITATVLAIVSFLGSANGLKTSIFSGGTILLFGVGGALLFETKFSFQEQIFSLKISTLIIILALGYYGIQQQRRVVYRDRPRHELTQMFGTPALFGIYTTPERVNVTDSVIQFLNHELKPDDTFLALNSVPMLYFLSEKPYWIDNPWDSKPLKLIKTFFNSSIQKYGYPDVIVLATQNPRSTKWPKYRVPCCYENSDDEKNYQFYQQFLKQNQYKIIYKNNMFEVYKTQ